MHYGDLIESAERALALADTPLDAPKLAAEADDNTSKSIYESNPWVDMDEYRDPFSDEPPF